MTSSKLRMSHKTVKLVGYTVLLTTDLVEWLVKDKPAPDLS